jgi:glycosyltransferase involved in cell wall biosynthesis
MIDMPLISICIPAYKQVDMIKRLLDSVCAQTWKNFEVIITDDTPDDSIKSIAKDYQSLCQLRYVKNEQALGTPENWNQAIRLAKGKWIKLMHQDDWFADEKALEIFYQYTLLHPKVNFFFASFANHDASKNIVDEVNCTFLQCLFLRVSPLHLFKKVYVGNPSCTLIQNDGKQCYDKRLKFVVDFEYYIRCFKNGYRWYYISDRLINVGFHPNQVTKSTFLVPDVQIPENNLLIDIFSKKILNNIFVFDYYWRMYRNLHIRSIEQAKAYDKNQIPYVLERILTFQLRIPLSVLKFGIFSKLFMAVAYLGFRLRFI